MTDVDAEDLLGIAIVAADVTGGAWEYSLDGGGQWFAMGTPTADAARLLPAVASARVRFLPATNFSGLLPAALVLRGWDQTVGVSGGVADATSPGGNSAFSAASEAVSLLVQPVNDAPVLAPISPPQLTPLVEDATSNAGMLVASLIASGGANTILDADAGALAGLAILGAATAQGSWQYTLD